MFAGAVDRAAIVARVEAHPIEGDAHSMRAAFHALATDGAPVPEALDGMAVRVDVAGAVLEPDGATGAPVLWLHGGGYGFGAPETHLRPAARLAAQAGRRVVLPRYRLAPEHRWPAQRDDAMTAVEALGTVPVLAGDSAGGHLALVLALRLARAGTPPPALLLFSPNTDRSGLNRARAATSAIDPMVDDAGDTALARAAFGDFDPADPEVSPLLDDLSLLPPTWIEVGRPEVLEGDAVLLAERAAAAGADVTLHVAEGLLHMGQLWAPWWDEGCASLDRAAAFLRGRTGDAVPRTP
ncbi:alpha/beta hydrolase [Jannaschia sp. W003]|uniref:alpha/beta hydrolase n=1 Tax=Jannaschia sp. W003 TaxID=2867012 RepID=UPI0021A7C8C8|nr:alpha/beta hydrolase [Jannaschia sp. W003]UWQ20216.1 alpha/beta hydrolase [Jannaschia sp. W003]